MSKKFSVKIFWSEEDDVWIAQCLELQGISAFGETPAEALEEFEIAIELAEKC